MGAMTALTFATRYPERLRTAMICGIDIVREPRASVAKRLMDPDRIVREEPEWAAAAREAPRPVQGEGAWQNGCCRAIANDVASATLLTPEELRRIRLPVQLVYGDRDVFVPADHAVAIHKQLPDSRLFICPNSPHQVMVSQPALFNLVAANFYRSTENVARKRPRGSRTTLGQSRAGDGADRSSTQRRSQWRPATTTNDHFSNW